MNSDERIIELLSDILVEQKGMRADIYEMKNDISQLKEQQMITNNRLEKLEEQQAKTNLAIGELRLSVIKLADRLEIVADHEKRIDKLEHTVYNS
jgi:uncharacterized coiled-coil protein SlyX